MESKALSRVDVEPMEPEQMAPARPAPREGRRTPSSQPQEQRPPRTQPEPQPQPEPEQRRYGRGQGFGGGFTVADMDLETLGPKWSQCRFGLVST